MVLPALVAAVATLGVEWMAKPRLEARKDRVIETYREQRAAADRLARVVRNLAELSSSHIIWEYPSLVRQRIVELQTLGEQLRETPAPVLLGSPPVVRTLLPKAAGFLIGYSTRLLELHDSGAEDVTQDRFLQDFEPQLSRYSEPLCDWFHQRSPLGRIVKVRGLLRVANSTPDDQTT